MASSCQACRLINGADLLPGGCIFATDHWLVEHCVGPLGVGTLIVKPFRHCLHVADLTSAESQELGPLLQRTSQVIRNLTQADQIYTCLWRGVIALFQSDTGVVSIGIVGGTARGI